MMIGYMSLMAEDCPDGCCHLELLLESSQPVHSHNSLNHSSLDHDTMESHSLKVKTGHDGNLKHIQFLLLSKCSFCTSDRQYMIHSQITP